MTRRTFLVLLFALRPALSFGADPPRTPVLPPPSNPLALLGNGTPEALAGNLRGYLVQALPPVLYEDTHDWGHMKLMPRGLEWTGKRKLKLVPEVQKGHKPDGIWRRVRISANNLRDTLVLDLRDVQEAGPGRLLFTVFLAFDSQVQYEQQNWRMGVRTYSGEVRARLRVKATLNCEVTSRMEKGASLIPDLVFRIRVLRSAVGYENLVVEHINGVGGEMAQLLGETVKAGVHQWKPSLERNALEKANAAIVKAGDTKDVRLSMTKLFQSKGLLP